MENWRIIPSFPDYAVSDRGRVCRVTSASSTVPGRLLAQWLAKNGYAMVSLRKNGKSWNQGVHALVAEAFIGPRPEGADVSHLDGVKVNNTPGNLLYESRQDNLARRVGHGTDNRGEKHPQAKINAEIVRQIRARRLSGEKVKDLAAAFGLRPGDVSNICNRVIWRSVE